MSESVAVKLEQKGEEPGGPDKSCVGSLNVLLFVNSEGQPSVKIEHWVPDELALDLLARVLPGVAKYLDSKRGAVVRPVIVMPPGLRS